MKVPRSITSHEPCASSDLELCLSHHEKARVLTVDEQMCGLSSIKAGREKQKVSKEFRGAGDQTWEVQVSIPVSPLPSISYQAPLTFLPPPTELWNPANIYQKNRGGDSGEVEERRDPSDEEMALSQSTFGRPSSVPSTHVGRLPCNLCSRESSFCGQPHEHLPEHT